jgi:hypothetical protein
MQKTARSISISNSTSNKKSFENEEIWYAANGSAREVEWGEMAPTPFDETQTVPHRAWLEIT